MPYAAPSRCSEPGCGEIATRLGRCDEHQRKAWSGGTGRSAKERLGVSGSTWQRIRVGILARDDHTCYLGCGRAAVEVDHVIPVAEGGARTDPINLAAICLRCHKRKNRGEAARGRQRRQVAQGAQQRD